MVSTGTTVIDYRDLLSSAETIDALPITVGRLATLISAGNVDLLEVVEVVSLDQALTATLLRRANSATVRGRVEIRTVRDAAVRLGASALLSMAMAASVSFKLNRALPAYGLAEGQLWKQSVAASLTAEVIRRRATSDVPMEAATAALLHDFGKVVLSSHFGPQVLELLARGAQAEGVSLLEVERAVFGVTHAEIGGLVAGHWKLPPTIVDAIVRHHDTASDLSPVSATVSLAHAMVPEVLAAHDPSPADAGAATVPPTETHGPLFGVLGLDPTGYAALLEAAQEKYGQLSERYSLG